MERNGQLDRGDGAALAWALREGALRGEAGPAVVFLPGFRSDMQGAKALALDAWCAARGRAMLRFDYSGHGASGGDFETGTIGRWAEDALAVIDRFAPGKLLLVGSSMGGWIALLLALRRAERVAGLVGIAAAADFTERLMWERMSAAERTELMEKGRIERPTEYDEAPYVFTRALVEEGRRHLLLDGPIGIDCPVRLLHGQRDEAVPWELALRIAERVTSEDVAVTLVKDGDHRLSRPEDLALLCRTVAALFGDGA